MYNLTNTILTNIQ